MTEIVSRRRSRTFSLPGAPEQVLELVWGAATDVGLRRAQNEDSVIAVPGVYAVADGLGGHAAGDVASDAAVTRLEQKARTRLRRGAIFGAQDVAEALVAAGEDIAHATRGVPYGGGTTVTGIAVVEHEGAPALQVFNLGDSRVYLFRDHAVEQLTIDHSYVQELVDIGQLTPEEAEVHPDANIITRALGFGEMPEIDRWILQPTAGMRLLVCSDGLPRELTNSTIGVLLGVGSSAEETARSLVNAAVGAGGRDNVTVAVVDVIQAPQVSGAGGEPMRSLSDTGVL
ncbi:MAG: serine/threonine-protein phosphatase [Microbacteriaceae bacterium]|nr:serine/threonine-protein phosphatase [Microbacteriaceae bacterium]